MSLCKGLNEWIRVVKSRYRIYFVTILLQFCYKKVTNNLQLFDWKIDTLASDWEKSKLLLAAVENFAQSITQKEIDAMPFDTNFFIKEEVLWIAHRNELKTLY